MGKFTTLFKFKNTIVIIGTPLLLYPLIFFYPSDVSLSYIY